MLHRFCSFWIYPLAGALLLYAAFHWEPQRELHQLVWPFAVGVLLWTLLEYGMHRFLFHWHTENLNLEKLLHKLHLGHHGDPRNRDQILVRPIYSVPISILFLGALYFGLRDFFLATGVLCGIWIGFLYYEYVHYRVHLSSSTRGFLGYQRKRHFYHHFVDDKNCFGVTSPLWDFILFTHRRFC